MSLAATPTLLPAATVAGVGGDAARGRACPPAADVTPLTGRRLTTAATAPVTGGVVSAAETSRAGADGVVFVAGMSASAGGRPGGATTAGVIAVSRGGTGGVVGTV